MTEKQNAEMREALESIINAKEPKAEGFRQPDDGDWRFYALEIKRIAEVVLRAAATSPHPRGKGLWSLHKQPDDCVTEHAYSIWFSESEHENAAPVILANASPGDEDKLQEIVDLANAAPPPAGADAVREALKPFAAVAEYDIGETEADADIYRPMSKNNRAPLLTVGDLRRAYAALLPAPPPQEKPTGDQT